MKVEYAYHFWKCADAVYQKNIKISPCLLKLQLAKVAHFLRHSVCPSVRLSLRPSKHVTRQRKIMWSLNLLPVRGQEVKGQDRKTTLSSGEKMHHN